MNNRIRKIIVVFKTHFDIGFTDLSSEVIKSYGERMLPDVIETCEASGAEPEGQRFVWSMPAWPLLQSLQSDGTDEETKTKIGELIRHNQIHWHALPFTTHTDFCGLEEFIRGMYFSGELSEAFGKKPIAAKMTDVPGHARMLPSLLRKAGVRFLHLGSNPFSTPPDVPRIFHWEGPDGASVVTFYNKGNYGSSLVPPEDWPFPVWLALMNTGDNHGPQKPEVVRNIRREIEGTMPGTEVVMGTLDDFILEILPFADELPTVRGDLADTWIHGIGTYPEEAAAIRSLRSKLTDTEKALTLGILSGLFTGNEADELRTRVKQAYEECILFGEHTFGMDVKKMGEDREYAKNRFLELKPTPLYQKMEKSWDEKRDRVRAAMAETERVHRALMDRWPPGETAADGRSLLVFNGLGQERSDWVTLRGDHHGLSPIEVSSGKTLRTRTVEGKRQAWVEQVPAMGFKTIRFVDTHSSPELSRTHKVSVSQANGTIENRWYKIAVDRENGVITSLFDKSLEHEWIDGSGPAKFGQYQYDVFGDKDVTEFIRSYAYRFYTWGIIDFGRAGYPQQPHLTYVPGTFRLAVSENEGSASLKLTGTTDPESVNLYGNASSVSLSLTLYDDEPYIDITLLLEGKPETPFVEAGHLLFPVRLDRPRYAFHKLGHVVDPASDIVRDANHVLYCCDQWVDITDGNKGLAIVPLDTPLFSIGEKGILKFERSFREKEPVIVFNLFNNSWGTNFPQWMGGDYTFRYRLLPHEGSWREGDVPRHALQTFSPLQTWFTDRRIAVPPAGFATVDEGMEILCLKRAEHGDGYILRLHDQRGESRSIKLSFASKMASLLKCDLLENPQETLMEQASEFMFTTQAFEVHTFLVRI